MGEHNDVRADLAAAADAAELGARHGRSLIGCAPELDPNRVKRRRHLLWALTRNARASLQHPLGLFVHVEGPSAAEARGQRWRAELPLGSATDTVPTLINVILQHLDHLAAACRHLHEFDEIVADPQLATWPQPTQLARMARAQATTLAHRLPVVISRMASTEGLRREGVLLAETSPPWTGAAE